MLPWSSRYENEIEGDLSLSATLDLTPAISASCVDDPSACTSLLSHQHLPAHQAPLLSTGPSSLLTLDHSPLSVVRHCLFNYVPLFLILHDLLFHVHFVVFVFDDVANKSDAKLQ